MKGLSFEAKDRLMLLMLLFVSVAPFIPFTGGKSLYECRSTPWTRSVGDEPGTFLGDEPP